MRFLVRLAAVNVHARVGVGDGLRGIVSHGSSVLYELRGIRRMYAQREEFLKRGLL